VFNSLGIKYNSIFQVGVGEATTLANLIPKLKIKPKKYMALIWLGPELDMQLNI